MLVIGRSYELAIQEAGTTKLTEETIEKSVTGEATEGTAGTKTWQ